MKSKFANVTLSVLPVLFLTSVTPAPALAQETPAQPHVLGNPEVNYPVHFDISPPLSEMATEVSPQQGFHLAPAVRYPKLQLLTEVAQRGEGPVADGALQTYSGPLVSTTPGLDLLGVGNGFPSYSVPDAPTDVNLAVGDTQVVQWVNVSYAVFNKTNGAVIAGPIAGNQFWAGFGGPCQTSNISDIIAQWDKIAHRWVMAQNVFSGPPYYTCVAISQTADATGSYYRFQFPQSGFPDYPKWGIWPDAYYQSQNNFGPTGSGYVGATACAYERAKMLVGNSTAKQVCFTTGTFDDNLLPGDLDSAGTLPPTGQAEVYLGSIDNTPPNGNVIYKYLFHVDFTTPSNSTFTGAGGTMPISVASFGLACGGGTCIPQRGIADQLDSLGDRLMYRLAYRNFSDHQTWLVSHSVTAGSSVGERWYEFHAPENSTSLSVSQQGTFAPDSNYRWMGSIAMDSAQDIALGYSISSSSMYPSISYTGRVRSDTPGTMENEAQIVAGTGSQTDTSNRWGDYTSMAIDEADDCTFWYTNQYYMATGSFDWSTRLGSFKFVGCGGMPTVSSVSPNAGPAAGGNTVTIDGTNFQSGATVKFGTTASATVTFVSATQLKAVAPAHAAGTVDVTVTTPGGTSAIVAGDHYTYDLPPTVSSVSPNAGPAAGGNTITIEGTNFQSGATVKFGTTASATVTFVSATQLKAVAPAHAAGTVDVTVTTPGGTSAIVAGDHYAYGPPTVSSFTPTSGITGSTVTINGTSFVPGATVKFGALASPSVIFMSGTQIKATVPNGAVTGKISVTTAAGTATSTSNFTVTLSITGFSPTSGPTGTVVTITGVGFNSSSSVKFNGTVASSVVHVSSTQLKATLPSTATTGPISVTNTTTPTGTVRSAANYTKT